MTLNTKDKRAEYHDILPLQKELWEKEPHKNLYRLIVSRQNIICAYDCLKRNTGSHAKGVDGLNIENINQVSIEQLVSTVRERLKDYHPDPVKRVYIEKDNGKRRPLGIPTIWDRMIQQCIKQIIEPICERKFAHNSYGFRPKRSQENALADVMKSLNLSKHKYIVNVDIKSFFDNVNHKILVNQLWSIGIRDKSVLAIIKKMLKAKILEPNGQLITPTKGTPQGGILSPLLSNVVLNDLDHWVNDQWIECGIEISSITLRFNKNGSPTGDKYKHLRTYSTLKEGRLVRYADDFVITCKTYNEAVRWSNAVTNYLKRRLKLDVENTKSKIINLRKHYSEFLGFKFKLKMKRNKCVAESRISDKKKEKIIRSYREKIRNTWSGADVYKLNSMTYGIWGYFKHATAISVDMREISWRLNKLIHNHFSMNGEFRNLSEFEKMSTGVGLKMSKLKNNCKVWVQHNVPLMPISMGKTQYPLCKRRQEKPYEFVIEKKDWREYIIKIECNITSSTEFHINKVSRYAQQKGKCAILKEFTGIDFECHHKLPKYLGGTDDYHNLIILDKRVHNLVHTKYEWKINEMIRELNLNKLQISKVNTLRSLCELDVIEIN
ncbi:group II intron reverse transcriptase/maturase [Metasolibacillus meyeri]|uniref:group II intron reverse transcriptase/maturase n=1 Tax=Metasolibacillus meyeri TaxID=1071052 RepID=UPI000D312021|nr:group II intron reverse transcriptase/maturase [Metasolibacillus meyeri]